MDVQVIDGLAAVSADVHDEAIAPLGDPLARRQLRADRAHLADQIAILLADLAHRGDVLSRQKQDVRRGPGRDVADGDHRLVGEDWDAGSSPAMMRQNRQSDGMARS